MFDMVRWALEDRKMGMCKGLSINCGRYMVVTDRSSEVPWVRS
jgi:hypothetical protein